MKISLLEWEQRGHPGRFVIDSISTVYWDFDHYVLVMTIHDGTTKSQNFWNLRTLGIYLGRRITTVEGEVIP